MKSICLALIAASTALAAGAARAAYVGVADTETGYVGSTYAYLSPVLLDGVLYDCISPDLEIYTGEQPYDYAAGPALDPADSPALTGYRLDAAQVTAVDYLVSKTAADWARGAGAVALAADASSVWAVEGAAVAPDDPAVSAAISADEALAYAAPSASTPRVVVDASADTQNLAAVPEPSAWALALTGAALAGGALRAARRRPAAA